MNLHDIVRKSITAVHADKDLTLIKYEGKKNMCFVSKSDLKGLNPMSNDYFRKIVLEISSCLRYHY